MINSIYTNKEIFLRELISNASDAIDKRYFLEASGGKTGMSRDDYEIRITPDKDGRTLTISDNGIGMSADEMENNLGTIAESGSFKFKSENKDKEDDTDIIGQFGVGFYSAYMVSSKIEVCPEGWIRKRLICGSAPDLTDTPLRRLTVLKQALPSPST